jgi:hypothetical protein
MDGIDVESVNGGLKASSWSIPHSLEDGTSAGPYLRADGQAGVVDVRTGKVPDWAKSGVFLWHSAEVPCGSGKPPYSGVVALSGGPNGLRTEYLDTATGETATIDTTDPGDTFRPQFIGADGKVYGSAAPEQPGDNYPAVLDLTVKKPKILTTTAGMSVIGASGDGMLVLSPNGPNLSSEYLPGSLCRLRNAGFEASAPVHRQQQRRYALIYIRPLHAWFKGERAGFL